MLGPLFKRSETLRKWNERWVILDPTTGKMDYNLDISTPQKKDYFLCAETHGAARAWVTTLQDAYFIYLGIFSATQLVLKAHKEAVDSLSGSAANSTALECSEEIQAAMQVSLRNALSISAMKPIDGPLDYLTIMKETLRVKDEELQSLARELRSPHTMDEQRKIVSLEFERLSKDSVRQQEAAKLKLKELEEKTSALRAVVRAEEKARVAEASGEAKAKEASQGEATAWTEKQELLAYVNMLQTQLQRQQLETKQVFEEKTESTNGETSLSTTKETEKDVDKACLSVSRTASMPGENVVHMSEDEVVNAQAPVGENEWNDIQATEARVSDVKRNI
ncbi:hypothetical protein BRARA_C01577 [Brassica rapa]|uniref:PH domain-containing protein n=1 Tax=Brassica campestris TaxID=3711 RepID=A0A397ZWF6_BRACM|nr:hypothetical protein BRARA_C01577 [Brassica rapa]